jgi:hypothetical protein
MPRVRVPRLLSSVGMWCHPILGAIAAGVSIWSALFWPQYLSEKNICKGGAVITLTPWKRNVDGTFKEESQADGGKRVDTHDFDPRLEHYLKVAEVIITLASASLVFIPTLHGKSLNCWFAFALVMLGLTVVFGLAFMAIMTYFYEMFLFDPKGYGPFRSSLMFSLGFTGFACFAIAYLVISIQVGLAYSSGSLIIAK